MTILVIGFFLIVSVLNWAWGPITEEDYFLKTVEHDPFIGTGRSINEIMRNQTARTWFWSSLNLDHQILIYSKVADYSAVDENQMHSIYILVYHSSEQGGVSPHIIRTHSSEQGGW
jgi:hypothetical protein